MTEQADSDRTVRGRRRWGAALLVALCLPLVVRVLNGGVPARLVAAEVDALEGGVRIGESVTGPGAGLGARLREGFKPPPGHPRLVGLGEHDEARRLVVTPPAPRWTAFVGVSVLPGPASATNAERASWAATLVVVLALLLWCLQLGAGRAAALFGIAMAIPEARDAVTGAGYGATAMLASSLVLLGYGRLARGWGGTLAEGPRVFGSLGTAALVVVGFALMLGVHPFAFLVLLSVFFVLPLARTRGAEGRHPDGGMVAVPMMPPGLVLWPVAGLLLFIVSWPSLWQGTGKRLMAYLLDAGIYPGSLQVIVSQGFDPAGDRAPQAFTALLQLVAWLPLPLLGLAVIGASFRREVRAAVLPLLLALLLGGFLDGGLNGARLSLWPLMWLPLAWLGLAGAEVAGGWLGGAFLKSHDSSRLPLVVIAAMAAAAVAELSGFGAAQRGRSGREADVALPLAVFDPVRDEARVDPRGGIIAADALGPAFGPTFLALRDHFEWPVYTASVERAAWVLESRPVRFDDEVSSEVVVNDGFFTRIRRVAPSRTEYGSETHPGN